MADMITPRSSIAQPETTKTDPHKKAAVSVAKATAAKRRPSQTAAARDRRKAAEMLREIGIDGAALSAQIERLRHRFL